MNVKLILLLDNDETSLRDVVSKYDWTNFMDFWGNQRSRYARLN